MTTTAHTCTHGPDSTGARCGKPAVSSFTGSDGTVFHECAEHSTGSGSAATASAARVGDHVVVHRYGKAYDATVTRVGARGAVYATFTYGNGASRTVRV